MPETIPAFRHDSFCGRIGLAREDITPPVGIYSRNWGAALHDVADAIHRPLSLTALTLQTANDAEPLVWVDADAGWWRGLSVARAFRARLFEALDIDSARILFGLTHTHAAVPLTDAPEPEWEGGDLLAPYLERLFEATVDAVKRALAAAEPATLTWHTGRSTLARVRDLRDPNPSQTRRVCGFDPTAVADDTLLVGRVTDRRGRILATLCHYACHPTTLAWENHQISPDYVGAMRETVERETGGALALFLQGASGDLAPRHQYVGDPAVADRHGRQLGYAVLATLTDMEPPGCELAFAGVQESGAPLALWRHRSSATNTTLRATEFAVDLPLKDWPSAEALEKDRQATDDRVLKERLRRQRDLRRAMGDGATFPLAVWIWELGDAVVVGTVCEAYSWMARQLREGLPERTVIYLNLVNGSIGYLPTVERYDEDVYQVWQTPFERGSLELLAAEILRHLRGL